MRASSIPRSALGDLVRQSQPTATAKTTTRFAERSNLDILLDEEVSLEGAMAEIAGRFLRGNPAANSTVDALMYTLRKGVGVLKRPDVRRRLACLDEAQMRACAKQLLHRNPEVAKSWAVAEAEAFVAAWMACHGEG